MSYRNSYQKGAIYFQRHKSFYTTDQLANFSSKTIKHIQKMYHSFGTDTFFGRSNVMSVTELKPARVSELLKELSDAKIIETVIGHGKGKYKFTSHIN